MFEDPSGRCARCLEEAKEYVWNFIAENSACADRRVTAHNHDYDLYLPWLFEIVSSMKQSGDGPVLDALDLQRLYMDAAWALVMDGDLRPGPKVITGDIKDGYGKGYSLTLKGCEKLRAMLGASELRVAM